MSWCLSKTASPKHEYAARTLRPKINRLLSDYLVPLKARTVRRRATDIEEKSTLGLDDVPKLVASLKADQSVRPVRRFKGGNAEAEARLKHYLHETVRTLRDQSRQAGGGLGLAHEPVSAFRSDLAGGDRARHTRVEGRG